MKIAKIAFLLLFVLTGSRSFAQEHLPDSLMLILKADDAGALSKMVSKETVNNCYGHYSLLSQTVRFNAPKCFAAVLDLGADVNKICNDYVPPLMHAAKYGRLDMVKALIAKGADPHYQYNGKLEEAAAIRGMTPLSYAEQYQQTAVADYLRTLK